MHIDVSLNKYRIRSLIGFFVFPEVRRIRAEEIIVLLSDSKYFVMLILRLMYSVPKFGSLFLKYEMEGMKEQTRQSSYLIL